MIANVTPITDSQTANSGRGMMNARRSIPGIWRSMAIQTIFTAGYGTVTLDNSKNLRTRG